MKIAWSLIIPDDYLLSLAEERSKDIGAGVTIYNFLRRPVKGKNCEMSYVNHKSHIWDTSLYMFDRKDEIDKVYDPDTMFIIAVQIPMGECGGKKCDVRIFRYDTHKEVPF